MRNGGALKGRKPVHQRECGLGTGAGSDGSRRVSTCTSARALACEERNCGKHAGASREGLNM